MKKLAVILPCYNEEEILKISAEKVFLELQNLINKKLITNESFVCFVDDGSKDRTWEIIEELKDKKLLLEREQYYLDTFQPYRNNIGYNIALSSSGGDNFTHNPNKETIRQQLSEMYSGENNPMFGKSHSKENLLKIQKSLTDRKWYNNGEKESL